MRIRHTVFASELVGLIIVRFQVATRKLDPRYIYSATILLVDQPGIWLRWMPDATSEPGKLKN